MIKNICLVSTFHDPNGLQSIKCLQNNIKQVKNLFNFIRLVVTDTTAKNIFDFISQQKIPYLKTPAGFGSQSRRLALRKALETNADYFLNIDFDRLLFWLETQPQELIDLIEKIKKLKADEYLIIGRNGAAWKSHPLYQQIPEEKTNKVISKEINKKVDVTAGCYAFSNKLAWLINKKARGVESCVSDIEWLMLAKLYGKAKINPVFVSGLAWETELIFGQKRAKKPQGEYGTNRELLAEETIKMINKVKNRYFKKSNDSNH